MTNQTYDLAKKYAEHFCGALDVATRIFDIASVSFLPYETENHFCNSCKHCEQRTLHHYGCYESDRWGGKYIYHCVLGLVFCASPIYEDDGICGSYIVGPIFSGDIDDLKSDGYSLAKSGDTYLIDNISSIPLRNSKTVRYISELLSDISSKAPHVSVDFAPVNVSVLSSIEHTPYKYPIEVEKKLQLMISQGDKAAAQELLNKLLGHIFFSSAGDFEIIKARSYELVVILSRASIESGADMQEVFFINANCFKTIQNISDIDELSIFLSDIMTRFINYSFDFINVKHTDIIYKVMDYIKDNYMNKITLDNISNAVFLSKSYLSRMFKEETGITLNNYINDYRIKKSKMLLIDNDISLIDIANIVGFEDQSYYTKVFKKSVGVSPGKFRDLRGNI